MAVKVVAFLVIVGCVSVSPVISNRSSPASRHQTSRSPGDPRTYQDYRPFPSARIHSQPSHLPSSHQQEKATPYSPSYPPPNQDFPDDSSTRSSFRPSLSVPASVPPSPPPSCEIDQIFPSSLPVARSHVDNATLLKNAQNERECVAFCCQLGPGECQYVWILEGQCYAVVCDLNPSNCEPEFFLKGGEATTYIRMAYTTAEDTTPDSSTQTPTSSTPPRRDTIATTDVVIPTEEAKPSGTPDTDDKGLPDDIEGKTKSGDFPTEISSNSSNSQPNSTTPDPSLEGGDTEGEGEDGSNAGGKNETEAPTLETDGTVPTTGATQNPATAPPTEANEPTIVVASTGDKEVTLPQNEVKIFASTWPEDDQGSYTYHWSEVAGPQVGTLSGKNGKAIVLSELVEGVYTLKLMVQDGNGEFGVAYINVTVHPEPRVNKPPTIVVHPSNNVTVQLPNDMAILEASDTTDDHSPDGLSYLWEEVTGPLDSQKVSEDAVLEVHGLKAGQYKFKLTVTDQDGAQSVTYVYVTVVQALDYPPIANAGNAVLFHLPKDEVFLYGNGSTDDKGIVEYSWEMESGNSGIDMEGSSTPILHVTHLTMGMYVFKLTVTDTTGKSSFATASVDVKDEVSEPPVASAGGNWTVTYPDTEVVLNGGRSNDDYRIITYSWTQVRGPTDVTLFGQNTSQLSVSKLHIDEDVGSPTLYGFQLQVTDHKKQASADIAYVQYTKAPNNPPYVDAGPDITIVLPENTAVLNGSLSADDFGIVSYQWSRSGLSPAAGTVVGASDTLPVLLLSNLINGTYNISLTVTNKNDQTSMEMVTVKVLTNPFDKYIVEVYLDIDIWNLTQANLDDFGEVINLALKENTKKSHSTNYKVVFQGVRQHDSNTVVQFYVLEAQGSPVNATDVYHKLSEKGQDYHVMGFHIVKVQTKECTLTCSGHGSCDWRTKNCVCDTFWMESPIAAYTGKKESNCQWSVFYVILVNLCVVMVIVILTWMCCCCCLRKRRVTRTKKRMKYAILDHREDGEEMRMLPKGGSAYQETSLMVSESDTEEEIIFDSSRRKQIRNSRSPATNGTPRSGKYTSLANSDVPK